MATKDAPTATQLEALRRMAPLGNSPQRLVRLPGGFWTTPATPTSVTRDVPAWYVTAQTVYAMEKRGWVERRGVWPEAWRDERRLTAVGLTLLEPATAASHGPWCG